MSSAQDGVRRGLGVDDVLITGELSRRPARPPAYAAENRALATLAQELAVNPGGVLDTLVELVVELLGADSAGISILEPGGEHGIFRWHAVAGAFAANLNGTLPREASPCGTVIARDQVLLFHEAERVFPALRGVEPRIYESLLAPWHADGQPVGTLWAIGHTPGHRFDAEDARLLQSLAHFAAAAWQTVPARRTADDGRAHLEERVRARTRELEATNEALRASEARLGADLAGMRRLYELHARLANETDLYRALDEIVGAAVAFTHTDRGCIQLVSEDGERLEMFVYRGYGPDDPFIQHFLREGSKPACDAARRDRRRLIIEDVATFPGLAGTVDREVALVDGIRATQSTPMLTRGGELMGVLSTQFRQPHRPDNDELRLIDVLAWTAADVVERHQAEVARRRLETERERRLVAEAVAAERQAVLKRIVRAQEEERAKVSREIHDSVTQLASAAALHLDNAAELLDGAPLRARAEVERGRDLARRAANEARRLIAGLRPEVLDRRGLAGALQQEVDALRAAGWRAELDDELAGVRLDPEVEITLFRVAQEALGNVRKHAGRARVRVRLTRQDGSVRLEVRDWGHGFELRAVRPTAAGEHVGLTSMRERMDLLGGKLEIRSGQQHGTTIRAMLPLEQPDEHGRATPA